MTSSSETSHPETSHRATAEVVPCARPASSPALTAVGSSADVVQLRTAIGDLTDFLMPYKFALSAVQMKIENLKEELTHRMGDCPIEHVTSRLKSLDRLAEKAQRRGCRTLDDIREKVWDVAGIRVVCSFITDVYTVLELLTQQHDVHVVEVEDYIKNPKSNGYKSIHLVVDLPVYLADRIVPVRVEVQIRTVAMDFWAAVEHKIHYRHNRHVDPAVRAELTAAAEVAHSLDERMDALRHEVRQQDSSADQH